jgi:hypothetical protein
MEYHTDNSIIIQKSFQERSKRARLRGRLAIVSLKDVPLDVRRREAKQPLFLIRYE